MGTARPEAGEGVLIIDFGGQYSHLILRRLRELGARPAIMHYSEVMRSGISGFAAVVLSGSHMSVSELSDRELEALRSMIESYRGAVLGICFGHQLLARLFGGTVERGCQEYGRASVRIAEGDWLFRGWAAEEQVWMSHGDCVKRPPAGAQVLATSGNGIVAAMKLKAGGRPVYGVQFHPEVRHTEKGTELLRNFLEMAGAGEGAGEAASVDEIVRSLRMEAMDGAVLAAVSGGVDSTVAALLAKMAFGKRLRPVFVDHGLLREGEAEEVVRLLGEAGLEPIVVDAGDRFISRLEGLSGCEERRRVIGEEFARVLYEVAKREGARALVQGTTYPDVVESGGSRGSSLIKSHHNVGGMPGWFRESVRVLEPLRGLYKDEVRGLAVELGVPGEIINRHPFPGPGLAVRVIGRFTREKLEAVRKASRAVEDVLREKGLYGSAWQAFAAVGDDAWVGVKGDSREQGHIVIVRVVESADGMTAGYARLPYDILDEITRRITGEVGGVSMVAYAVTTKPPSTIEPC